MKISRKCSLLFSKCFEPRHDASGPQKFLYIWGAPRPQLPKLTLRNRDCGLQNPLRAGVRPLFAITREPNSGFSETAVKIRARSCGIDFCDFAAAPSHFFAAEAPPRQKLLRSHSQPGWATRQHAQAVDDVDHLDRGHRHRLAMPSTTSTAKVIFQKKISDWSKSRS